jgi:hypothetical protein
MLRHQLTIVSATFIVSEEVIWNSVAYTGEVGPSRVVAALKTQLSERYGLIVSLKSGHALVEIPANAGGAIALPLINLLFLITRPCRSRARVHPSLKCHNINCKLAPRL